jgi:hypothetical protein
MNSPHKSFAVIGVDPGLMTGIFVFEHMHHDGGGYIAPRTDMLITPYQVPADEVGGWLWRELDRLEDIDQGPYPGDIHIAVERYIITSRTAKLSQQHEALEVTGAVKSTAAQAFSKPKVTQYAKANLKFANDDVLRRIGWYTKGMRHANDAARQAYALLKDVDYPTWLAVSNGAMMEIDDTMKGH